MTATEARRELPRVPVRLPNGEIVQARTTGRLNELATVTVHFGETKAKHLHSFRADCQPWADDHYSWQQVAHAAEAGELDDSLTCTPREATVHALEAGGMTDEQIAVEMADWTD